MAVEWRGDAVYGQIVAGTIRAMRRATEDGVRYGAQPQSRVLTGRYRREWRAEEPVLNGTTVHGEIVNEATNDSGQFYGAYVSAGTSKMAGDFAHAAALDTAATRLVGYIADEVRLP